MPGDWRGFLKSGRSAVGRKHPKRRCWPIETLALTSTPSIARRRGVLLHAGWHWLAFYAVILLAWAEMFRQALPSGTLEAATVYGIEFWLSLCSVGAAEAGFSELLSLWLLMSMAMMLPTFAPALATYDRLRVTGAGSRIGFVELTVGFLLVWAVFSLAIAVLQAKFLPLIIPAGGGAAVDPRAAAAVVAAAGIYQFLPFRDACLAKCRSPFMFFMANWRDSAFNELVLGLRMGAVCVSCCWLLMAISVVAGAWGLLWMGLATVLMCLEKLPDIGRRVSRPLGIALLGAAAYLALAGS